MTTRRGFLGAILAAGVAPAVVGGSILMPVRAIAMPPRLVVPFGSLVLGDRFTLAGVDGTFVVREVLQQEFERDYVSIWRPQPYMRRV